MLKGAIFDFDGTLFDSMFIWDTAGEVYLRYLRLKQRGQTNFPPLESMTGMKINKKILGLLPTTI